MLRTLALAAVASIALGSVTLVPTDASAHGWRHRHHHHGHHHRHWRPHVVYRAPAYAYHNPCLRKRWVPTPWGPRLRTINVCYR
jgi:hypothetical protein